MLFIVPTTAIINLGSFLLAIKLDSKLYKGRNEVFFISVFPEPYLEFGMY